MYFASHTLWWDTHNNNVQAVKRALEVGGAADPDVHRITLRFVLAAQDLTHPNVRLNSPEPPLSVSSSSFPHGD